MNCKEFHSYWEAEPCAAINFQPDSTEWSQHVSSCSDCNRFAEEQKELAESLRIMRDFAPAIPAAVDGAVLARYRGYVSEQSRSPRPVLLRLRLHLREALAVGLAVAFAIVVAYGAMLLLIPARGSWVDRPATARQPMVAPKTATGANRRTAASQRSISTQPKRVVASTRHRKPPTIAGEQDSSVPTRFQSLMYCDPISCPGAMDVIRVQLPSPIFGIMPGSAQATGFVSADVLVGPDGIARGIRLVE